MTEQSKALDRISNSRGKARDVMHAFPCNNYNCPCNELFINDIETIRAALTAPKVEPIEGLDIIFSYAEQYGPDAVRARCDWEKLLQAVSAYLELTKGAKHD